MPTCLPLIRRRCHVCACGRFRASGKFRVNAHHKLIDVWLLVLCTACGDTAKLTVLERVAVSSVPAKLLDRLHDNDSDLVAELLQDPGVQRRNRIALDWAGAWRLDTEGPDALGALGRGWGLARPDEAEGEAKIDVSVRFAARIPVRPVRLVAQGCGLSRAEVERLARDGKLVSVVRLDRKLSSDFTFTLGR